MISICTSVIAGKNATAGNTVLVSRNEDFGTNNWNKYLKYRHSSQYQQQLSDDPSIEEWTLGNGLKIPIPAVSYAYSAIPDAAGKTEATANIEDYYYFEERGCNEKNVVISATNSMQSNDSAQKADPFVALGIEESILLTLLLPQVESAFAAVELLGYYVETYGAMEANGISIADAKEAWYFEIGSGHHWIAVKIPSDSYIGIANCMVVHDVNLNDSPNVKCSKNLFSFVQKHHLLVDPDEACFHFAKAFGQPGSVINQVYEPYYNVDRLWLIQSILTPSLQQEIRKEQYPMFLKPDHPIHVSDIMRVLRANYDNTPLEGKATRPIGVVRTAESHIITIDEQMPEQLQCVIWQAVSSPLGSCYMPIFSHTNPYPQAYALGESSYNPDSAYWHFRSTFALADVLGKDSLLKLQEQIATFENCFLSQHAFIKKVLKSIASYNYEEAIQLSNTYSINILNEINRFAMEAFNSSLSTLTANQKDQS